METVEKILLDDTLRVARVLDLVNRSACAQEIRRRAWSPAAPGGVQIGSSLSTSIGSWTRICGNGRHYRRSWRSTRQHEHGERILGYETGIFHADRTRLLESVGREAQRVVADTSTTSAASDGDRRECPWGSRGDSGDRRKRPWPWGGGPAVAGTAAADITGILAAGVLAALGLLVIPAKRRRARAELREKVTTLRARLGAALPSEFDAAQARNRSAWPMAWAMGPIVRARPARWTEVRSALEEWRRRAAGLTSAVERLKIPTPSTSRSHPIHAELGQTRTRRDDGHLSMVQRRPE